MTAPEGLRRFEVVETREAVQITLDNLAAVAEWCGGRVSISYDEAEVPSSVWYLRGDRGEFAEVGDVLVRDGGHFHDLPAWMFERDCLSRWRDVTGQPERPEPPTVGCLTGQPLRIKTR